MHYCLSVYLICGDISLPRLVSLVLSQRRSIDNTREMHTSSTQAVTTVLSASLLLCPPTPTTQIYTL